MMILKGLQMRRRESKEQVVTQDGVSTPAIKGLPCHGYLNRAYCSKGTTMRHYCTDITISLIQYSECYSHDCHHYGLYD